MVLRIARFCRSNRAVAAALMLLVVPAAVSCRDRPEASLPSDSAAEDEDPDQGLTFRNITLEQADDDGAVQWRVVADQAIYSQDRQDAEIENLTGEFFRDGEPAYDVSAREGDVLQNGAQLVLRDQVVITDLDSGAVLEGDELTWNPEANTVTISGQVTGTHPDLEISASSAEAYIDEQRIEIEDDVKVVNTEGTVQLSGDRLVWDIEKELLTANRPLRIQQRQGNQVTHRASADRASFNVAEEVATLQQNAIVTLQDPPIRLTGDALRWNMAEQTVTASQPFTVVQQADQTIVQADRGQGNLESQVFKMQGNVSVLAQRTGGRLTSDRLTWTIPTQNVVAEQNVVYRQPDPALDLKGDRAVGRLDDQTLVVTGDRVVTEIVPDALSQ
ncbi:MAG: LPS export ABC transporter periplasmic protein LptC [Elainellaceae cyanobacterium]